MGLLDDAIREHLELKRRRGADPTEVAREEHEALDPPSTEYRAADSAQVQEAVEYAPEAQAPPDQLDVPIAPVAAEPPISGAPLSEPAYQPPPEPAGGTEPPFVEPIEAGEPHHEAQAPVEPPSEHYDMDPVAPVEVADVHQPTAEYALEDLQELQRAPAPEAAPEPEPAAAAPEPETVGEPDELEETPEFLQETPEHDRLWFEQKPPRDFDF